MPTLILRTFLASAALALVALPACVADTDGEPTEDVGTDEAAIMSCKERSEVVVWAPSGGQQPLLDGLTKDLPCTHYYVVLPVRVTDKTTFNGNVKQQIDALHARGKNFHAVAEFHWSSWRKWVADSSGRTWLSAGLEFRRRMDDAGFELHYGDSDTWFVQEIGSTVVAGKDGVTAAEVRSNVVAATRGLYRGGKLPNKKGGAMRVGVGHDLDAVDIGNLPVAKARAKAFLEDDSFWAGVDETLRFWSDEVYVEPRHACVAGVSVGARATSTNAYAFRLATLAEAGGTRVATARNFLRKTYTPLLNGTFGLPVANGYGETRVPRASMEKFLPLEIYSAVAYTRTHESTYGTRLGFAWLPGADEGVRKALGEATSSALNLALAKGASFACGPTGTLQGCECAVSGATLEEGWSTFAEW